MSCCHAGDATPLSSGSAATAADGAAASSAAAPSSSATAAIISPEAADRLAAVTDKNSALYRAAVKIQASYRGYVVRKAYQLYRIGGVVSEILYSPATYGLDLSVLNMPKPKARIGALVRDLLFLFTFPSPSPAAPLSRSTSIMYPRHVALPPLC
ncbi:hypothetical protein Vafri_11205 [Volvox africanus]|nr:hypothetical protein Vafri_11205 [Volvox africanus]